MPHSVPESRYFLNSYRPLVASPAGRTASVTLEIPPFVDGSIRREPDLQHEFPSISCICRAGNFAPRLRVEDTIAYMTVKGHYGHTRIKHRRLTAVMKVKLILRSHRAAAEWYLHNQALLPNNCMVPGNAPKPLAESHRQHRFSKDLSDDDLLRRWDALYRLRASRSGVFVVCKRIFCDLSWEAPIVEENHLRTSFGRIPATRNPGALPGDGFHKLMNLLGIVVPPSA